VFLATPVMRTVERMLFPSQRQQITWARRAVSNCLILTIMLESEV